MQSLNDARETPCQYLGPDDVLLMAVTKYVQAIREQANKQKLFPQWERFDFPHSQYLKGRLHGVIYGCSPMADFDGDCELMQQAAMNETEFLLGEYLFDSTGVQS